MVSSEFVILMMPRRDTVAMKLAEAIAGRVIEPDDADYDAARSIWNAMVDQRPAVIVRCVHAADVAVAIRHARERDLAIGVRCGGHSVIGHAVPEGGLMIDLTLMDRVSVDPRARTARVQGGALLGALDRATQPHGLATTAGNVSHTGVGGLTLGGGMGWLARKYGLTCDNVESFEVVTAAGDTVTASASENTDLFWGLRGGGGNFGVVTSFEFRLHPIICRTVVAEYTFSIDNAKRAMSRWRDLLADAPRQATLTAWIGAVDGKPRASLGFIWVGDPAESQGLQREFTVLGTPSEQRVTECSYLELQSKDDDEQGHALRRYWKGHYLRQLTDEAIEAFLLRGTSDGVGDFLPAARLQAYGGRIADVGDDETAFSHRDALVEFVASSRWDNPAEDDERLAAARRYGRAIEPFASGVYVNALTDEGAAGMRRAYPEHKRARLTDLKDAWDPDNVFRLNHNVAPSS